MRDYPPSDDRPDDSQALTLQRAEPGVISSWVGPGPAQPFPDGDATSVIRSGAEGMTQARFVVDENGRSPHLPLRGTTSKRLALAFFTTTKDSQGSKGDEETDQAGHLDVPGPVGRSERRRKLEVGAKEHDIHRNIVGDYFNDPPGFGPPVVRSST
jgi:hypothetical protein